MSNNYSQCTPDTALETTKEEGKRLCELLNSEDDGDYHGFQGELIYEDDTCEFYMYADDGMYVEDLPEEFLKELGKLIAKNNRGFLTFGYACTCDKMRPGEFGGGEFRITKAGEVVYPEIVYAK